MRHNELPPPSQHVGSDVHRYQGLPPASGRDDIEDLRVLYGSPERQVLHAETTANPPEVLDWILGGDVSTTLRTNTPVTLSTGAREEDDLMIAGFTDLNDEVRYFSGGFFGWDASAQEGTPVRDGGGDPIRTWDRVVTARGTPDGSSSSADERLLVAWIGGSAEDCCEDEGSSTTTSASATESRRKARGSHRAQWV